MTRRDQPPMLPMWQSEAALIGFARDVLDILGDEALQHVTERVRGIVRAAERRRLATAWPDPPGENDGDHEPWLIRRNFDGLERD